MFNLQNYSTQNIKNDILSGALVAVALVPEAIAFSFIAGVSPVVGLYGAFIIGLITALLGGKPGMISGPGRPRSSSRRQPAASERPRPVHRP